MLWVARASAVWAKRATLEVVQAELYDVTMHHTMRHTGTRLSLSVAIIEMCVWKMCRRVPHTLDGKSYHSVGQAGCLRVCTSSIV